MKTNYILKIAIAILLTGCGNEQSVESSSTHEKAITKAEYGTKWPFTVESGTLKCVDGSVIFTANGKTYGVNGASKSHGYADIEEIWAVDSSLSDGNSKIRMDIGIVLADGVNLCK